MPVLHLITGLAIGGAERVIQRLVTRLDRARFAPRVAALGHVEGPIPRELRAAGIPVDDLGIGLRPTPASYAAYARRLFGYLRAVRPTILHTWMFHANIPGRVVARLARIPYVVSSEVTLGQESRKRYLASYLTGRLADIHFCNSEAVARFARDHIGLPPDRIRALRQGIPVAEFRAVPPRAEARAALGLPGDGFIVGSVARLHRVKRLDVLLDALAAVPDASLVLVGTGPERDALAAQAHRLRLGERLRFAGVHQDPRPWFGAFDVLALTSDWEGLPNVVMEAMAGGLPVVATAVGGVPELVADGATGLLVPRGDAGAVAAALRRLRDDPELRARLGAAGRARAVAELDFTTFVTGVEQIYGELLARG